ncbi:hypothetical protein GCWU000324_01813 [Kingella oralis ATCC 51147]|uniref:Uncharacterized protein n=1 Tax=Kingella oralis ATCC 51147 TaxID=629741 RepID=C4GIE3_9NEIS|nr:hypothetical protein GCWU000324_01813 [Kingella oralis ATCC 51147]
MFNSPFRNKPSYTIFRLPHYANKGSLKNKTVWYCAKRFFYWIDWLSGCLTLHNCLILLPSPLRPAERSIFFSGKSVRLSDDARSAASSHAPKKGCSLRKVWRAKPARQGRLSFALNLCSLSA